MSWRPFPSCKPVISLILSFALVALSPGFAAYEAAAAQLAAPGRAVGQSGIAPITGLNALPVNSTINTSFKTSMDLRLTGSLPAGAAPEVKAGVVVVLPSLPAPVGHTLSNAGPEAALPRIGIAAPAATLSGKVSGLSSQIGETLQAAGPFSRAGAETAHSVGTKIDAIIHAAPAGFDADREFVAAAAAMGDLPSGLQLARPAGQEISQAAQAYFGANETKVVRSIPEMQEGGPAPKRAKPLLPRLAAAGLALLPGIILGIPMLGVSPLLGGVTAVLWGGSVILASLSLAALPFMHEGTPKAIRVLPGVAVSIVGLVGLLTGAPVIGALALLGGWGLVRYGRNPGADDSYDSEKSLTAFFGGLGAVTGVALGLMNPLGWVALGFKILSYPTAALLLMHLPSWVGSGITAVFRSSYEGVRGMDRVQSSLRRDTLVYDRLVKYTRAQLKASLWNAVWLAAIWVPLWLSQAGQWALAAAGGLAVAALQAPVMFLWGSAHALKADSAASKFFAAWAHFLFDNAQGSKKAVFNRLEIPLLPYANSQNKLVSIPATFAIRLAQWAWLAYTMVGTPVFYAVGLAKAFGRTGEAYDSKQHDPSHLRVDRDDVPDTQPGPEDPDQPGKPGGNLMPRLMAAGIALLPAYFLGLPLLAAAGPVIGGLYLGAALSLAALPFLPASTPKAVKVLPGVLLAGLGLLMFYLMPVIPFGFAGLALAAKTNAFWMSAVSVLGGWGLTRYLGKTMDEGRTRYGVDDPEYIGAFFGAVAAVAGLGLVLTGLSGWLPLSLTVLAYVTSPLLLMHLPRWVFSGLGQVFDGAFTSFRDSSRFVSLWEDETEFYDNVRHHARYWLNKSVWNGSWLSVIWVPMGAMMLADWIVSLGLGLAWGTVRAPFNFIRGAVERAYPDSRAARFFSGFLDAWRDLVEGKTSREYFIKHRAAAFIRGASEKVEPSGRPSFRAAANFGMLRLGQLFYLAALLVATPVMFLVGLGYGLRDALRGEPPAAPVQ